MTETRMPSRWDAVRRAQLTRILFVYLGASYAILEIVDIFIGQLGLPEWFFPGVVVLLLVGLPIVIATALVQGRSRQQQGPAEPGVSEAAATHAAQERPADQQRIDRVPTTHWLTWRRAILGFVGAFALWGVVVAGYMAMRALGIGPVGSLVAAGVLDARERLIIADFQNNTGDPLLGRAATEAFRIDFSQSEIITVVDPASVAQTLSRMERDPQETLDLRLAREVAIRDGVKAVVGGDITPVGSSFYMTARLVSAADGEELAAYDETAGDSTAIIDAIDKLSNKLRARIGESLKTIRASEPLDQVTTPSLEALRKYSHALDVIEEGDNERGLVLLEEAVSADTAFAMAWRKLGIVLSNMGRRRARQIEALTKAYDHRDHLTERERYLAIGTYHLSVTGDRQAGIAAYESLLDQYPNDTWALNNLGVFYRAARDFRRAEELFRRAVELDSAGGAIYFGNTVETQVALGEMAAAEETLEGYGRLFPDHPNFQAVAAAMAGSRFDYANAEKLLQALRDGQRAGSAWYVSSSFQLAQLAQVRGRLAEAEELFGGIMTTAEEQGEPALYLNGAILQVLDYVILRGDVERGRQKLEAALQRHPLSSLEPQERPYAPLAIAYALIGETDRAEELLVELQEAVDPQTRGLDGGGDEMARGAVALAEGRHQEAIEHLRAANGDACTICALPLLGQAYDAAGQIDSVIAVYERYLNTPWLYRVGASDWYALAGVYERLGGIYELRGNPQQAIHYYRRFVELWQDADPQLQPRVERARGAIERLAAEI
ncbi:MAG: tetratricopeptide repeat protein [Gemmatimonadota bacterium]|nr:MAG: tetratricopeptide repeat protein [Gemmatimonadota bacterium]